MKRVAATILLLVSAAAVLVTGTGAGEEGGKKYTVELDNAFGLVVGADLKVAGVRAGKITEMRVDRRSKHALVDFKIDKAGFGSLRRDTFCETRPQSLIGEYFIDCLPGTDRRELPEGSVIPVKRTGSTIPADLVNNIMRRPYRERLRIILNELGAGVGARAEDLNDAIRRASPALRETDEVLAILGRQNRILRDLTEDADTVIGDLAGNRRDVGRWAKETREAASASAERRDDIAAGLHRLPAFLRELRPTMAELGKVADAQIPSLQDLEASASQLERFFENLDPFSKATQANLTSLGETAGKGRPAVRAARPTVAELNRFSEKTPELANNLAIVLEDLDDRGRAVEKDPRSPGGQGYTGFEALMQYFFDQAMAINVFDNNGHILKVNAFHANCSEYQSAESLKEHLKEDPDFLKECFSELGPNQQGITIPDPTAPSGTTSDRARRRRADGDRERPKAEEQRPAEKPRDDKPSDDGGDADAKVPQTPEEIRDAIEEILGVELPDTATPELPGGQVLPDSIPVLPDSQPQQDALLDFLFGS